MLNQAKTSYSDAVPQGANAERNRAFFEGGQRGERRSVIYLPSHIIETASPGDDGAGRRWPTSERENDARIAYSSTVIWYEVPRLMSEG